MKNKEMENLPEIVPIIVAKQKTVLLLLKMCSKKKRTKDL